MSREAAVQAAVAVLDFHLPDSAYDKGCALRCGYSGDELATHLVEHILNAAAPHMQDSAASPRKSPAGAATDPPDPG